jgi:hypothetical protein
MFYSTNEIFFMSRIHGTELERSCENYKKNSNYEKTHRSSSLLQGLVAVILPITKKL